MSNQLEQMPRNLPQKQLHRLRLLPLVEFLEDEATLKVPALNGLRAHVDMLESPLMGLEQWETELLLPAQRPLKGRSANTDTDDPKLEMLSTIPMMVLKDIAKKQGQSSPEMQSEISGAASNAAIVGVGNVVGFIFKYGNNLLIQRSLGAVLFGLFSVSFSIVTLVASILDLGLDNAMIRYIAIYKGKQQPNLMRNLILFCSAMVGITGMLGAFVVLFFAPWLSALFHKPTTTPILLIMAPLVPVTCMQSIWIGGLQGLKEFKKRVFVQRFLVPLVVFALMLVVAIAFPNITWVAVVTFVSTLLSAVINLSFLFRAVARAERLKVPDEQHKSYEVRTWLGFAIPNFLTQVINTVLDSIDTLLLAFFVPALAIGQYAAAIKISGFILLPMVSLNVMFSPTIAELHARGENKKLAAMFKVVTHWTITLSLPVFIIATIFSIPLLGLSGPTYVPAWPLLIALSTGYMFSAAAGAVGNVLLMTGHQKYSLFNSLGVVALNLGLGIVLTSRYGAMGTAISTGLAIAVVNLIRVIEVRFLLKMHPYRWDMLKPLGAGVLSTALVGLLLYMLSLTHFALHIGHYTLSVQLALIPVFLACYFAFIGLLKISPEDKIVVDRLRKRFGRGKKKAGRGKKGGAVYRKVQSA